MGRGIIKWVQLVSHNRCNDVCRNTHMYVNVTPQIVILLVEWNLGMNYRKSGFV